MSREPVFVWRDQAGEAARLTNNPSFLAERMHQAAMRGEADAQLGWAHMLLDGHGVSRDVEAAFRWFQLASRSGLSDAINMLGRCHERGWGTPPSVRMASQCYRIADGMGHAWAQFNLASLMLENDSLSDGKGEALSLLVRSARGGNAKAMNLIGQACEEGWRGRPKPAAARRWFFRAARRGCFRGCAHIARYVMADGNIDGAAAWLFRSIETAPANFCTELGDHLAAHPSPLLRKVAAAAHDRARTAPQRPPSQPPSDPTSQNKAVTPR